MYCTLLFCGSIFRVNYLDTFFSFLFSLKWDRHDHPKEAEEGNTTQTEEEKKRSTPTRERERATPPRGGAEKQHHSKEG